MTPLLRAVPTVAALALLLAACGQPRSVAQQGPVCQSMATFGQLPEPFPDITPQMQAEHARATTRHFARRAGLAAANEPAAQAAAPLPGVKAQDFRAKIAAQAEAKRAALAPEPTKILSVSAGGAWGSFSIGFL